LKLFPIRVALASFVGLVAWGTTDSLRAQPLLNTESLCGPGEGNIGTNWISLPSDGILKTAEDLCAAISPTPSTVSQQYPDGTGLYTWDCVSTCSSTGTIPEPGCTTSACFCITPGEAVSVVTSAPSVLPIYGCDAAVPIDIPIASGPGVTGSLVSVPFHTFLSTVNDLGLWFGLPTGITGGTVVWLDCATGAATVCTIGTSCQFAPIVPGKAYRLRVPSGGIYSATNPVACLTPSPPLATCPIDSLMVSWSGGDATLTWSPPDPACTLPLTYQIARFDPDCIRHYCVHCATCSILGTTAANTFTDTPPLGTWDYFVSVVGGTWNSTGTTQCVDRDIMFGLGCP